MLRFNSNRLLVILMTVNVLLVALYVVSQATQKLHEWLDLDAEANVPAWYSGVLLLAVAVPAGLRAAQLRQEDRRSHWKIYALAAGVCVFLSADEIGTIHETLNRVMAYRLPRIALPGTGGRSAAGIFAAVLYAIVLLAFLVVLRKDAVAFLRERRGRASIFIGGAMIVVGGVLVDNFMPYHAVVVEHAIEEFLEMTGTCLVLYGFLRKLDEVTIRFNVSGNPQSPSDTPADRSGS